jgi:hypothetical protein
VARTLRVTRASARSLRSTSWHDFDLAAFLTSSTRHATFCDSADIFAALGIISFSGNFIGSIFWEESAIDY